MIRQAELADFDAITHIRTELAIDLDRLEDAEYRVQIQSNGFLLPSGLSAEQYRVAYPNYIIAERDDEAVGYLRLHDEQDMVVGSAPFWHRPELRKAYYAKPHAYIWGIGVLSGAAHQGVATEMLQTAEQRVRAQNIPWLFSEIVMEPVTNLASMMFHEKNGFKRIAVSQPFSEPELHIKGFQYLLYGKQLLENSE